MTVPLISLITPSYQQAAYLPECIASVHELNSGQGVDHIVVDGGSTDGSKEVIEQNAHLLTWWCCEKDNGQSDAINKGLAHATGAVFGWLNSDDALLPDTLRKVSDAFAHDPDLLVFGGRLIHRSENGDRVFERLNDTSDTVRLFADPIVNQQSTFYRMHVVKSIGGVDPALRYVMDVELWWQLLFRFGTSHLRFDAVELAIFRMHSASKTMGEHSGFIEELADLLHGLCTRVGHGELAAIIAIGYPERKPLRGIPANAEQHAQIVHIMAVHFLLKWNGHMHTEPQFGMLKTLCQSGLVQPGELLPEMKERWDLVKKRTSLGSWNLFRAQRKIKHLFR